MSRFMMSSIEQTGMSPHWPGQINKMTTNLIKHKDTDGDRALNPKEFGVSAEVSDKVDLLGGGHADRKELNAAHPRARVNHMTTNLINDKDTDGDGVLNLEEFGVSEEVFAKIDHNGDSQVDRKELNAARQIAEIYKDIGALQTDNDDEENENTDEENENIDLNV